MVKSNLHCSYSKVSWIRKFPAVNKGRGIVKKWRHVVIFDVVMALLIILLYSPYQLALSPLSPNFFNAAASIIFGAIIAYETVKVNGKAIKGSQASRRLALPEAEVSIDDVKRVLQDHRRDRVVGSYAVSGIAELDSIQKKQNDLYNLIGGKFQAGSLSYNKFTEVVDTAATSVVKNASILAKRIIAFDVNDYNHVLRDGANVFINHSTMPPDIRSQRRQAYENQLDELRNIVAANERILLELDRFSAEISSLEATEQGAANSKVVREINDLVQQASYYR